MSQPPTVPSPKSPVKFVPFILNKEVLILSASIVPVSILPPSITVVPLEPKSPATSAVVLVPAPSTRVFVPLNLTKPVKLCAL